MTQAGIQTAINWACREGWNPGLNDAGLFFQADENGFFEGVLGDDIIAVGSAVVYDSNFAFCGLYIVDPEYRGNGYGMALTTARLKYCGNRNVGIDGVLENVKLYEKIGYRKFYENARYQFTATQTEKHPNILDIKRLGFNAIKAYDRQCFPATRDRFLKAWIEQDNALSVAWLEDDKVKGYAVRRKCFEGYKIGPLFADNIEVAEQLVLACQYDIPAEMLFLDIPDVNSDALRLAAKFNMKQVFSTARMYQKELPRLDYSKIFGITTFELG